MKFTCIVADPPYNFSDKLTMSDVKRSSQSNYSTMTVNDIKALPISDIADPSGCLMCLWVPSSLLQEGIEIMNAWGFHLKTTYVWIKQKKNPLESLNKITKRLIKNESDTKLAANAIVAAQDKFDLNDTLAFGMGHSFRAAHELCLIGIIGDNIYKRLVNKSQRSVSFAYNEGHSIKPTHLQNSLDVMFPNTTNKLELFARRQRHGWTCIGNQCQTTLGEDITTSLSRLIGK
jgi:N6-adenosine-specific RNA methylase IME4